MPGAMRCLIPNYGSLPKHINVHQRDRLGWVDAARKLTVPAGGSAKNVPLDRASLEGSTNRQMIVLSLAATDAAGTSYYTVEARSAAPALMKRRSRARR